MKKITSSLILGALCSAGPLHAVVHSLAPAWSLSPGRWSHRVGLSRSDQGMARHVVAETWAALMPGLQLSAVGEFDAAPGSRLANYGLISQVVIYEAVSQPSLALRLGRHTARAHPSGSTQAWSMGLASSAGYGVLSLNLAATATLLRSRGDLGFGPRHHLSQKSTGYLRAEWIPATWALLIGREFERSGEDTVHATFAGCTFEW